MRRRLFNLAAAVSLVLCVATVALWVRSYWVADQIEWKNGTGAIDVISSRGQFGFTRTAGAVWADGEPRSLFFYVKHEAHDLVAVFGYRPRWTWGGRAP